MKKENKLQNIVLITYAAVLMLLLVFTLYMSFAEHNSVYQAHQIDKCEVLEHYTKTTLNDPSAPIKIRNEYCFTLPDISVTKDYLAFYIVHHYAEVRIDGELVYRLTTSTNNRIGFSPSSNWIFIPLGQADSGREVQVIITPVYKSVVDRKVQFMIGARSDIVLHRLRNDLPQIILAALCISIGSTLMIIHPFLVLRKKLNSQEMFYLGNFLLLIGIWRITDTRFSPIFFAKNPMSLGYITIAALFICCVPLLLFIREHIMGRKKTVLLLTALVGCVTTLIALICQVFQIAELRETLFLCHIMLLVSIVVILLMSLFHIGSKSAKIELRGLIALLIPGVIIDLLFFYCQKSSSQAMFTILALLVYTIIRFIIEMLNINRKIHIDTLTGLFNRRKWNDLMENSAPLSEAVGVMMLDLNRLKYINDTLGHEMGDRMILGFANILHKVLSTECMIFRWGGDEFTVLVPNADHDKMKRYISEISEAATAHNLSGEKPEIHFAVGYALSTDYPTLSQDELMKKADEKMYHNKSEWYRKNVPDYHL